MGIICDKLGHKWQLGICKRCGEKMDVEKEVKFIAVCGHIMKPNDIARIKAALLEYHDQEKLAWVISQELAKCDIGMYGGLGNGKAVLQEIGRSVLAQQRR